MDKVRLLIVEKHTAVRIAVQTRLRSSLKIEGVAAVKDIAEGLLILCDQKPDAALFGLSGNGDHDLDEAIADITYLSQCGVAVIVLTAYANRMNQTLFLKAGASRCFLKDINSSRLIDEIKAVIGHGMVA